jgi:large exoprotein involved in heme utilization and adhesion
LKIHPSDRILVFLQNWDAPIQGSIRTETLGAISGSKIDINTPQLNLIEGGALLTSSYSPAPAGALSLNTPETLNIIGYSPRSARTVSTISSIAFRDGRAGDITIDAGKLSIQSGGILLSGTGGNGDGGTIKIKANAIELLGSNPTTFSPSTIGSSSAGREMRLALLSRLIG